MPSLLQRTEKKRIVLYDVPWKSYVRFIQRIHRRRRYRTSYDRGTLEIMTISFEHEDPKELIGQLIDAITAVMRIPRRAAGSATFKKKLELKGLEPDRCYYFHSERLVRGKKRLSLLRDPPPDLAIDITVTHSEVDRMAIYAAFKVPEVWCYQNEELKVFVLGPDGNYAESNRSFNFPFLPLHEFAVFLRRGLVEEEMALVEEFRDWAKSHKNAWSKELAKKK